MAEENDNDTGCAVLIRVQVKCLKSGPVSVVVRRCRERGTVAFSSGPDYRSRRASSRSGSGTFQGSLSTFPSGVD
jgi:hypothetical protein